MFLDKSKSNRIILVSTPTPSIVYQTNKYLVSVNKWCNQQFKLAYDKCRAIVLSYWTKIHLKSNWKQVIFLVVFEWRNSVKLDGILLHGFSTEVDGIIPGVMKALSMFDIIFSTGMTSVYFSGSLVFFVFFSGFWAFHFWFLCFFCFFLRVSELCSFLTPLPFKYKYRES